MVSRLPSSESKEFMSPIAEKSALVIDLDGTYVRGNTLRIYILEALADAVRSGRILLAADICCRLLLRRLRLVSHRSMKFGILRRTEGRIPGRFTEKVKALVNRDVRVHVEMRRRQGWQVLLATAAPDFYIPLIWDGPFVATSMSGNGAQIECRGNEKQRRVELELGRTGAVMREFMTDHPDDLALWRANEAAGGTNILVDKNGKLREGCELL